MIERLIENWLTNANERGYEVPFCQLLMTEGHRIIHLNRHSPMEQGKDIISLDEEGRVCGFQLKGGDINLTRWRKEVHPEIVELIETQVEHPAVKSAHARPFVVTNGRYAEEVVHAINTLNRGNAKRGFKALQTVDGRALAKRFIDCHGRFLPHEPKDFEAFLRLFLANGRDMLPKSRIARFLQAQLDPTSLKKPTDIVRAIASTVVLAAYALSAYQRASNHLAIFEGWVLVAAAIARLVESKRVAKLNWEPSFLLALGAARLAMSSLVQEIPADRPPTEGKVMMDGGPPYRARLTLLIGTAAAFALVCRARAEPFEHRDTLNAFIAKHERDMLLWGESAVPFFISLALWLEQCGQAPRAEAGVQMMIDAIVNLNAPDSKDGFPVPYYGVNRCVAALCRVASNPMRRDSPVGSSFSLDALIEFLVRRLRKQTLKLHWEGVTHIHLCEMEFAKPVDFYLWRTFDGQLSQRYVKRPQAWGELVKRANEDTEKFLPDVLRTRPDFALMFALVYPHRFGRGLLRLLESAATAEPSGSAPSGAKGRRGRRK